MNEIPRNIDFENGYLAALRDLRGILDGAIGIREEQLRKSEPEGYDYRTIIGSSTGPVDSLRIGV